jgi:RNA polymerase sigma-70 factor (ECF subfamily)
MQAFATTRWSLVLAARDPCSPQSAVALEALCQTYWRPLYGLVRRLGHRPHDAEDLTQAFFARLLAKGHLQAADRQRGRFRTFLRVALKRFLANEWDRAHARKRGGASLAISLNTSHVEALLHFDPADPALTPDVQFERHWALALLEDALARLQAEVTAAGKAAEFLQLKEYLAADRGAIPYARIAADLAISEAAARVAVHRLRKRFRDTFRQAVADTVADPKEVEDELRYIADLLARG